jgi:hypothetical protein
MNDTAREDFKAALEGLIATARENGLSDEALIGELADAAEALRDALSQAAGRGPARGSGLVIPNCYDNLRHGEETPFTAGATREAPPRPSALTRRPDTAGRDPAGLPRPAGSGGEGCQAGRRRICRPGAGLDPRVRSRDAAHLRPQVVRGHAQQIT